MEISLENLYVDIGALRVNFYIIAPANTVKPVLSGHPRGLL